MSPGNERSEREHRRPREELPDVQMVGAPKGPSPHARTQTQGGRATRPRPEHMPACLAMRPPLAPLRSRADLRGSLAIAARNRPSSTSSPPHDHGTRMRTISVYPASSPMEDMGRTRCSYATRAPKTASLLPPRTGMDKDVHCTSAIPTEPYTKQRASRHPGNSSRRVS